MGCSRPVQRNHGTCGRRMESLDRSKWMAGLLETLPDRHQQDRWTAQARWLHVQQTRPQQWELGSVGERGRRDILNERKCSSGNCKGDCGACCWRMQRLPCHCCDACSKERSVLSLFGVARELHLRQVSTRGSTSVSLGAYGHRILAPITGGRERRQHDGREQAMETPESDRPLQLPVRV